MIRRLLQKNSFGLTSPLITLASGAKMGKTEKGAVWLNDDMFSPYDYWQFWRNTDDRDVKRFLNFFTELDLNKINELCESKKNINDLKIILANEATKILHGEAASKKAQQTAKDTFEGKGLSLNLPEIKIKRVDLKKGINILEFLSKNKIFPSKSEARRTIANNGLKINNVLIENEKKNNSIDRFQRRSFKNLSREKKHFIVKIT